MGIANIINNSTTTSGGEIIRELVNSSDGAGLHFDGSGVVAFTPVDLGSKFSHEFVLSTSEDLTTGTSSYIVDYHGSSDRFIIGFNPSQDSGNLAIFDNTGWKSFGVNPLTDLKVHHIVVTVDGTSAVLYDNGNQVGTATISASHGIDSTTNAGLAGYYNNSNNFEGTIYRARSYNRTLSADDVRTAYERADVPFADQYGRQAVNDGGFTSASNWLTNGGWSVASNKATFTASGGTGRVGQNSVFTSGDEGKQVHITFTVGASTGTIWIGNSAGTTQYVDGGYNSYTVGTHTVTFTLPSSETTLGFYSQYASSGSWEISNVGVYVEGCVSDYDLAFANPTQSLTVQDRAGVADGTASTSGVTQVQPVVQGNLTSLAVTTSQQAAGVPADGSIVADKVGAGISPAVTLHAKVSATTGTSPLEVARLEVKDEGSTDLAAGMGPKLAFYMPHNSASFEGAAVYAKKESGTDSNEATSLSFSTIPDAFGAPVERLTIDSTGDITQTASTPALVIKDNQDKSWAKNDALGSLQFHTADTSGVGAHEIAGIHTETDEAGTNTQVAGAMVFKTAPYNNATPVERMRIGSDGNVKIGNSSAVDTQLSVECDTTGEAIGDGIRVQNAHGVNNDIAPIYFGVHGGTRRAKAAIGLKRTGSYGVGELRFAVDSNSTDTDVSFATDTKLMIDSTGLATFSNGINLGDTNLSTYAEGSFTPTIAAETGTINGTNVEGRYTRIGNVCHVWFSIECTGVSGASGAVEFGNFPFTSSSIASDFNTPMVVRYVSLGSAVESLVLRLFNNSTGGRIEEQNGTSVTNLADNVQNGTIFQVAGSYRV